jgi:hypothetical protein
MRRALVMRLAPDSATLAPAHRQEVRRR